MGDTYNIERIQPNGINEYAVYFVNENNPDYFIISYIQKHALFALLTVAEKESSDNKQIAKKLQLLHDRLINIYGESENVDYHIKTRETIRQLQAGA